MPDTTFLSVQLLDIFEALLIRCQSSSPDRKASPRILTSMNLQQHMLLILAWRDHRN